MAQKISSNIVIYRLVGTELNTLLEIQTLCFSSYENHNLKVKLLWVGAPERKKSAYFVTFAFFSEGIYFNTCVLSQCIVYRINFQNIYTFTYQKTLLYTLLLLIFKIVVSLQCILKHFPISTGKHLCWKMCLFSNAVRKFSLKVFWNVSIV